MSSEREKPSKSPLPGETTKGPPPPIPPPPSAGRVLALKYYKKVSKSLAKGFKKPSPTTSPTTPTSPSGANTTCSISGLQNIEPEEDHNYEIVLHSSIEESTSPVPNEKPEKPNTTVVVEVESDTGGSVNNESGKSEYGSAEDHFENESSGLVYENVSFSSEKNKNQGENVNSNLVHPNLSQNENTTPTPTDLAGEVVVDANSVTATQAFTTSTTAEDEDEEDDDSSKWDTSFGSSSASEGSNSNSKSIANSKSEASNHSPTNAIVDKSDKTTTTTLANASPESPDNNVTISTTTTTNSTTNTTVVKIVHRPPLIPKFPSSSTESSSSSTDESYSSCSSRPYGEVVVLKSNLIVPANVPSETICSSSNGIDNGGKNPLDDDDQATDVPKGNEFDEDTDDTGMDENDTSAITGSESDCFFEDLVQAVTQKLTLTLNNTSKSVMVSLPSNGSESKSTTLKRPETGPGNEVNLLSSPETDHEYQNVFIRNGHICKGSETSEDRSEGSEDFGSGTIPANRFILSESGVTTIAEGHNENYNSEMPVVHAVINLPPKTIDAIRQRRRKAEELSYQKSSRLSRMMLSDYRAGMDRPETSGMPKGRQSDGHCSDSSTLPSQKSIASKARIKVTTNVEKVGKSVSTMRKRVGSWYQRRVKTPVENLSSELGLENIKLPGGSGSSSKSKSKDDLLCSDFERSNSRTSIRPKSRARSSKAASPNPNEVFEDESDYSFVVGEYSSSVDNNVFEDDKEVEPGTRKGQNEFEDLRRLVKQGGDFCKDLATVLHERSELESQYAKGLSKLSAKLLKASKEATGSVAHAWQAVAVQIDTQAELHRLWSTALAEELSRPLRNSTDTQHKIRKSVEVLVEKTTRNLADWRTAEAKAKRQCFSSSKEFEKLQESSVSILGNSQNLNSVTNLNNANSNNGINNNNANNSNSVLSEVRSRSRLLSVPPMEKDPMKLEAKRRKAEEAVRRADIEYYTFCVRSERARLEWEGAIRNGSTCLRTLEEEKLSLLRDLALKYFQNLNDFAPKLVHSVESLEEPVKACSVDQDMHSIVDIRRHVGAEQLLPDFYAEDTSNLMKRERRQEALQKFLYLIKQDLEREKKGAAGVETLAKAIAEGPKIVDNSHHDISDKLYYMRSMLLYLEASRCKVDNAMADVEGRQRSNNPITQYMRHQRDKQGLPQTILKVPSWARDDCLAYSSGAVSAGSSSPDWNDRGNGDGTSGQHDTDFGIRNREISSITKRDEFGSEGSVSESNEEFGEEDHKVTNNKNLIAVPSIGKCRAIYDYDAQLCDELTIRIGDEINIHDKQEDGWWLGELNGTIGIFPATYVEEHPPAPSPTN